jgi:hypothetical protein
MLEILIGVSTWVGHCEGFYLGIINIHTDFSFEELEDIYLFVCLSGLQFNVVTARYKLDASGSDICRVATRFI